MKACVPRVYIKVVSDIRIDYHRQAPLGGKLTTLRRVMHHMGVLINKGCKQFMIIIVWKPYLFARKLTMASQLYVSVRDTKY